MAQKNKTQSKVRTPKAAATRAAKKAPAKTTKVAKAAKPAAVAAKTASKTSAKATSSKKPAAKAPVHSAKKPVAVNTAETKATSTAAKKAGAPVAAKAAAAKPAAAAKAASAGGSVKPAAAAIKPAAVAASAAKAGSKRKPSSQRAVAAAVTATTVVEKISPPAAAKPQEKKDKGQRHGFKLNEYVVYPAHGVGRIVGIEEQEIAGHSLELFVITFEKEKLTLRVPTGKLDTVGMRKLAEADTVKKAMDTLKGRARVKRTMWSRRAQEYVAKINSGSLISIAEVVRDLYRSEAQPEQSYSERQLYEDALDRMARELAAVEKLDERGAVQRITDVLSKSAKGRRAAAEAAEAEAEAEEAEEAEAA
ncbi:MAG TPA: CarD family transcriptional regulator [Hyphomicrobiaceae bacterium]|nr:CarD family transcriptional regulator [Hyphomicrobiaceae bacterium]